MCYQLWQSGEAPKDRQKPKVTAVFKKGKGSSGQSASSQSLIRCWSTSFWRPSLCTWVTRRWSQAVSMDSLKVNQAWPTDCFLWWNDHLNGSGKSSGCCLPQLQGRLWHCLSQHPHSQTQEAWTGWVNSGVEWELAEDHDQWPQRVMISGTGSCRRPLTVGVPRVQNWLQCCLTCSSITGVNGHMPPEHVHWWHKPGTWHLCHKVGIIPEPGTLPPLFFFLTSPLCQPGESHLLAQAMAWGHWGHWCWLGGAGQPGLAIGTLCLSIPGTVFGGGVAVVGQVGWGHYAQQLLHVQTVPHLSMGQGWQRQKCIYIILTPLLLSYSQSVNAQA